MSGENCKRCGKNDHPSRKCKATFAKSWIGQPAMKILLRFPDGMTMEMTCALTVSQFDRIEAVCREAWGIPPKDESDAAKVSP